MKVEISGTEFGSITIGGTTYDHDIIIRLGGKVEKRKKKLSKEIYGTSHIISRAEAEFVYEDGVRMILIGTGQSGMVELSDEAEAYFAKKGCSVEMLPTPQAVMHWNALKEPAVGLFHITC